MISTTPATIASPSPRAGWRRRHQLVGLIYAIPTLAFVAAFFLTPLVLVVRMSVSSWPLLTGDRGVNFPKNFAAIWNNQLFWPAVVFTIEYTVLVTILLIGLGLAMALLVQEAGRWVGALRTIFLLPVAVGRSEEHTSELQSPLNLVC